jgi:hypothetical protein
MLSRHITNTSLTPARACRQQEQRELRKQRKRLRDICCIEGEADGEELWEIGDVEDICAAFSRDELKALCDALDAAADEAGQHAALEAALQTIYQSRGEVRVLVRHGLVGHGVGHGSEAYPSSADVLVIAHHCRDDK